MAVTATDEYNLIIAVKGTSVYTHDFFVHGSTDPEPRSAQIIYELDAGDTVEFAFLVTDVPGGDRAQARSGTTANIYRV